MFLIVLINNSTQNNNLWVLTDSLQEKFVSESDFTSTHLRLCATNEDVLSVFVYSITGYHKRADFKLSPAVNYLVRNCRFSEQSCRKPCKCRFSSSQMFTDLNTHILFSKPHLCSTAHLPPGGALHTFVFIVLLFKVCFQLFLPFSLFFHLSLLQLTGDGLVERI